MRSVAVKRALGTRAAALLHPDEACDRIEREVRRRWSGREAVRGGNQVAELIVVLAAI